jgi:hypothetical protein
MPPNDFVHFPDSRPLVAATAFSPTAAEGDSLALAAPADKVVRPVLAVLFRVAIGPRADRYAPRFLAFERAGHVGAGWHWPSLLAPSLWAFYRRLWVPGVCYALFRFAVLAAVVHLWPGLLEMSVASQVAALAVVGLLPGIVPAALADWLLYRRVRALVRRAESCSRNAAEALSWLSARLPTSESAAVLLSFTMLCAGVAVFGPAVWARHTEHVVRIQVADAIAAVQWLQARIEESLLDGELPPSTTQGVLVAGDAARVIDAIDVSPASGRVRVGFGDSLPELAGKWILLAPLFEGRAQFRWLCIPVDIPAKYLPKVCGGT